MKRPRGRWAKAYESTIVDKAYYTNAQWRAFMTVLMHGSGAAGRFSSRAHLVALLDAIPDSTGEELVAFLVRQRDVRVYAGGRGRVEIVGWETYQGARPDPTAAERMRRSRARKAETSESIQPPGSPPVYPDSDRERYAVTDRNISYSESRSQSPTAETRSNGREPDVAGAREGNGIDHDAWAAIALEVERLTRKPAAIRNPYGGLGIMARDLVADFGLEATIASFQRVASRSSKPDASVIILGANRLLRPLQSPKDLDRAEEEELAAKRSKAARERTAALIREQREWVADSGSTSGTAKAYDAPSRALSTPQVRGSRQ